ncbi:SHUGOSHIN 2-like [Raphanus sativus]|uniref:SHUGOSHIN 2-like n=1 Tax=Raphanus sativus TaxID=3726 RepID=A0A9W3BQZ8_RAPSA|nr:SHUGOSHIN 2-like [Raphanus sativus]
MSKKAASACPIKPTVESGVSSANSVSAKRNGKSVVCSDVPIKGRSGTSVPSAKNAQLVFFRDVKFGPQETQLRFRLIHFWEARNVLTKNLIGLEMLMIDEQVYSAIFRNPFCVLTHIVSFSASESSIVKPIQVKESANSRSSRKVSRVIDTTVIPEVTCQTEDDVEKGVVSQGENQTVDNIINKKFVAANPVKDSLHSKRLSVQRKSTRFAVQETQQTETKVTKEIARLSLRRRSARLRPEEAEPCKSFHERGEVRETTKRRSVVSEGSRSEALEPSESGHDTSNTNGKRSVD